MTLSRPLRTTAVAAVCTLALAACTSSSEPPASQESTPVTSSTAPTSPTPSPATAAPTLSDGLTDESLDAVIARGTPMDVNGLTFVLPEEFYPTPRSGTILGRHFQFEHTDDSDNVRSRFWVGGMVDGETDAQQFLTTYAAELRSKIPGNDAVPSRVQEYYSEESFTEAHVLTFVNDQTPPVSGCIFVLQFPDSVGWAMVSTVDDPVLPCQVALTTFDRA